jgi:hypothetical protein
MQFKNILSVLIILVNTSNLYAQQNTSTTGLSIVNTSGSISYTIGQLDYTNTTKGDFGTISEGMQQVYTLSLFTNTLAIDKSTTLSVWPNPIIDHLYIKLNSSNYTGITYQIMRINGQLIENKKTFSNNIKIETNQYPIGAYIILVSLPNQPTLKFKIIKQ